MAPKQTKSKKIVIKNFKRCSSFIVKSFFSIWSSTSITLFVGILIIGGAWPNKLLKWFFHWFSLSCLDLPFRIERFDFFLLLISFAICYTRFDFLFVCALFSSAILFLTYFSCSFLYWWSNSSLAFLICSEFSGDGFSKETFIACETALRLTSMDWKCQGAVEGLLVIIGIVYYIYIYYIYVYIYIYYIYIYYIHI